MTQQQGFDDLERLADLRDKGIITEDEFAEKKAEILAAPLVHEPTDLTTAEDAPPTAPSQESEHGSDDQRINNAFLIEVVAGLLGFLGVGYLYAGKTEAGLIRLVGWWILVGVMWTIVTLLTSVLIGVCLIIPALIVQFGVPIMSANKLKAEILTGDDS